jgi:hypothetical protein
MPRNLVCSPTRRGGAAFASLRGRGLVCELEVLAPQLTEFASVAASFPDIKFVLPVMGWPLDLTTEGRAIWSTDLTALARHPNVAVKIFGLECIFGIRWTVAQVRSWISECYRNLRPGPLYVREPYADLQAGLQLPRSLQRLFCDHPRLQRSRKAALLYDTAEEIYRP